MHSRLVKILKEKQKEVARLKGKGLIYPEANVLRERRNFSSALTRPGRIHLIAEIKFASPSAGRIREEADPAAIGRIYEQAGASALSVLTDGPFFGGRLVFMPRVKEAVRLPILRKDFIIDEIQIDESALWGADAVLLIVRILGDDQLTRFLQRCRENRLDALVEVHDRMDLERALKAGAEIIGINNRDLDTFRVRLETTRELAAAVPPGRILVGESGFRSPPDLLDLQGLGLHAVLIGSALMQAEDLEGKTREMVEAGKWSR
jgi:indole-3-glycerol phosphate synthase